MANNHPVEPDKRRDFLIAMYNQLMNDINRHIVVLWQSIAALVGTLALLSLVEKNTLPLDIAVSLTVLISAWVIAHVHDAAYWYNRNLVIIANIERQFLVKEDLRNIHYYFGAHRSDNKMITHLRIQLFLAAGIALLMIVYQFIDRLLPVIRAKKQFELMMVLPYAAAVVLLIIWCRSNRYGKVRYKEFLENSPGIDIDASGIRFGVGHPTKPSAAGS